VRKHETTSQALAVACRGARHATKSDWEVALELLGSFDPNSFTYRSPFVVRDASNSRSHFGLSIEDAVIMSGQDWCYVAFDEQRGCFDAHSLFQNEFDYCFYANVCGV